MKDENNQAILVQNEYGDSVNFQTVNSRPASSKSWISPFMQVKLEGKKSYAERRKESRKISTAKKVVQSKSSA